MAITTAARVTSLNGFHATPAAQRADQLVRALFDAVNADDPARTDDILARSFLSYDVHGTRSRTGLKRYHSDLRRSFSDLRLEVSTGGLLPERLGTDFGAPRGRTITREESRASVRRLYDGESRCR